MNQAMRLVVALSLLLAYANAQPFQSFEPAAVGTGTPITAPFSAPVAPNPAPVAETEAPVVVAATLAPVIAPVTPMPITAMPVTEAPTTMAPVSPAPITFAPVTAAPVTAAPVTAAPVTAAPVTAAPITAAPVTAAPITAAPVTTAPITTAPVTGVPSLIPSSNPSGLGSPLPSLSDIPSMIPTLASLSPTADNRPTVPITIAAPLSGLSMSFTGMAPLSPTSIRVWQNTTKFFITGFYSGDASPTVEDVATAVTVTAQDPPFTRRLVARAFGRSLQSQTTLTYTQDLSYRANDPNVGSEAVAEEPFITANRRLNYVRALRNTNDPAFSNLVSSSNVNLPNESTGGGGGDGLSTGAIIGIAVGSAIALAICCGGIYSYLRVRSGGDGRYYNQTGETPPTSIKTGNDDVSVLDEPASKGGGLGAGESLAGYGDQSVATIDYDYSKAYGGGADHSVSSAGGTFGSNPNALGANQGAVMAGVGAATLGSFSDDGSYEGAAAANVREELIDIYAPAGKLGVVIDTPDDGAPVVHAIKDSSVIADKLQVGDKLVAVDDEDVRTMTAIKVSKLISRKSGNPSRKLSVIRTTLVE